MLAVVLSCTSVLAQGTGSVKGKVRTDGGNSIPGVKITARKDGKNLKSATSNRKGEFRLSGLAPGKYNLVFDKTGFASGVLYNVLVKKGKVNNLKNRLIMTVDQGTLVIISGSVFNQVGRSIYGAKVKIVEVLSNGSTRRAGTVYSSRSGTFTFRFPEGKRKFRITASAKGRSASKEVTVDEPAIYRLAISLEIPPKKS